MAACDAPPSGHWAERAHHWQYARPNRHRPKQFQTGPSRRMNTQRKSTHRKSRRQNARSSTRLLDWPPRTAGLLEAAARVLAAEFGLFFGIEVPVRAR